MADNNFDYSDYITPTLPDSDDRLIRLSKLCIEMVRREKAVADAEAVLQSAKQSLVDITETSIPNLMAEIGCAAYRLESGQEIEIVPVLSANISAERAEPAHAWLEANNQGGLIKRRVVVSFSREQEAQARHLVTNLKKYKTPMPFDVERKVEPPTLKKAVKEMMEQGILTDEAKALLGVFQKKVAKIAKPGAAKKAKGKGAVAADPF